MLTRVFSPPPIRPFDVRDLYKLEETYDNTHVFIGLEEAQRLFHMSEFLEKLTEDFCWGFSQRSYSETATQLAKCFGLSASAVGQRFIAETTKSLDIFMNRRFDDKEFIPSRWMGRRCAVSRSPNDPVCGDYGDR